MSDRIRENDFWRKIIELPRSAGREVFEKALTLYVLLTEAKVPVWVKTSCTLCLLYFLCPIDAVPDFLPGGYLDDLGAMALLLSELHIYSTPALKQRVEELMPEWAKRVTALPEDAGGEP